MQADNKRIAKNTLLLYVRLFITMIISLYTSRAVLEVLGVSDYGLYNLIGGAVSLFAFVNGSLVGCIQRYLNVALGRGDDKLCKETFKASLTLNVLFIIAFILILEGLGYFMLNHILNIPEGREDVAALIYQLSLFTIAFNFLIGPFEATIIAYERMDFYAYLSIFDVLSKLGVVYLLYTAASGDRLTFYAFLLLVCVIILFLIYVIVCFRKFPICSLGFSHNKPIMKEMFAYTFWNLLGHFTYIVSTQGYNIVFNIFLGTVVNAARGIAVQITSVVSRFALNMQTAFGPQIVKLYAVGEINEMYKLIINATKYSFYLVILIAVPLYISIEMVLDIWLTVIPENTVIFVKVLLIEVLLSSFTSPVDRAITATGKVISMNVFNTITQLLFLGVTYFCLLLGAPLLPCLILMIMPSAIRFVYTLHLVKKYLNIRLDLYYRDVLLNCLLVLIISFPIPYILKYFFPHGLLYSILLAIISVITTGIGIIIAMGGEMRKQVAVYIKNKIL